MKNTKIEWADHTFNFVTGCTKVSPGCANCYAEGINKRFLHGRNWGPNAPRERTSSNVWKAVEGWNRKAKQTAKAWDGLVHYASSKGYDPRELWTEDGKVLPHRPRVFCASMADWLDPEIAVDDLRDLLELVRTTPYLDWLLLTKRPERWRERMNDVFVRIGGHLPSEKWAPLSAWVESWMGGDYPLNAWIGTSVEDQEWARRRMPHLFRIPAFLRFLSVEPMLGPVDLTNLQCSQHIRMDVIEGVAHPETPEAEQSTEFEQFRKQVREIDWVIAGGESGPNCRLIEDEWFRSLRDQCEAGGIPFFLKQFGCIASRARGWRDSKGGNPLEWEEEFRIREFPDTGLSLSGRIEEGVAPAVAG